MKRTTQQIAREEGYTLGLQYNQHAYYAVDRLLDADVENHRTPAEALGAARRQRKAILAEQTPECRARIVAGAQEKGWKV